MSKSKSSEHIDELGTKTASVDGKLSEKNNFMDFWKTGNSTVDIHELFAKFDKQFFEGRLNGVKLRWSKRMTLSAGLCIYKEANCRIRLSTPLRGLRPHSDLVDTLLHEMIHAYLFVTKMDSDHGSHGPEFLKHMNRINQEAGTNITVYHSLQSEVKLYKQCWWRCNGPCQGWPPYFGMVKRSIDRAPCPSDHWWDNHKATCSGQFTKIHRPIESKKKTDTHPEPEVGKNITNLIRKSSAISKITKHTTISTTPTQKYALENIVEFIDLTSPAASPSAPAKTLTNNNRSAIHSSLIDLTGSPDEISKCPICNKKMSRGSMNEHLEGCDELQRLFDDNQAFTSDHGDSEDEDYFKEETHQCPVCALHIKEDMTHHINDCLLNVFDEPTLPLNDSLALVEENQDSWNNSELINVFDEPTLPLNDSLVLAKDNGENSFAEKTVSSNSFPLYSLDIADDIKSHQEYVCLDSSDTLNGRGKIDIHKQFPTKNCDAATNVPKPISLDDSDIELIGINNTQ